MPNERSRHAVLPAARVRVAQRHLSTAAGVLVAVVLVLASTRSTTLAALALIASAYLFLLAMLGRERVAIVTLVLAFATAPMNKGLAPSPSSAITPTDLLLGLGVLLLIPSLLRRSVRLPTPYVIGISLIMVTGTLSTAFSPAPLVSSIQFVQWLIVIVGLLGLFALWAPSWRLVDALMWSYVAGHMASVAYSPFDAAVGNRHLGLSHHPNEYGGAGAMTFALTLYLWHRHDALWYRLIVIGAALASAVSAVTSGSRAATVVIAGLILMVPFVERSAVGGFLIALAGALFVFLLPTVVGTSGEGSGISRLAGSGDALTADQARLEAQDLGVTLFLQHPLVGNGFSEALYVHNVMLAVASSAGLIGLIGYLLVLYTLARPIIGSHPNRRLGYAVWAFIAITPTFPGLEDRTLWVPMAAALLLAIQARERTHDPEPTPTIAMETR